MVKTYMITAVLVRDHLCSAVGADHPMIRTSLLSRRRGLFPVGLLTAPSFVGGLKTTHASDFSTLRACTVSAWGGTRVDVFPTGIVVAS